MSTQDKVVQRAQVLVRLERQLVQEKLKARKKETRRKIEWGGLVVKANMHKYSKAVILGALIDAAASLAKDESLQRLFQLKGEAGFLGFE